MASRCGATLRAYPARARSRSLTLTSMTVRWKACGTASTRFSLSSTTQRRRRVHTTRGDTSVNYSKPLKINRYARMLHSDFAKRLGSSTRESAADSDGEDDG